MTTAVLVCAALALWLSTGALTLVDAHLSAPRVGLLPSPVWLLALVAMAVLLAFTGRPTARRSLVLLLSSLALLPWLPFRVPTVFLIWAGPLQLWLWIAIATAIVVPTLVRTVPQALRTMATDPRRAPWLAAAVAACAYAVGAWQVFPRLPGGDEPHYLVITQSLLEDHDLQIENNHLRGDYRQYYNGPLRPDYLRRGINGEIYSIHAPGLSVLVAPAFAMLGYPGRDRLPRAHERVGNGPDLVRRLARVGRRGGELVRLGGGCALGALLLSGVRRLSRRAGRGARHGWRPGDDGGLRLIAAPFVRRRLALAILPWLHTRFALAALVIGVLVIARNVGTQRGFVRVLVFLSAPAASALAWLWFFHAIYGTPNPAAPYGGYTQSEWANVPHGVIGLLVDQQFGLLTNAPVYLCAALGLVPMLRRAPRLTIELLLLVVPYGLVVAAYHMWWGGHSSPVRFLVPVLLPLAIVAGVWFASTPGRAARALALGGLLLSLLITATLAGVDRGAVLYNVRDGASRLLLWMSPLVDLTTGLPSFFQHTPVTALGHAVVWVLAGAFTVSVTTLVARRSVSTDAIAVVMGLAAAASSMINLTIVWRLNHTMPLTPSTASLALLRRAEPEGRDLAVRYSPLRPVLLADLVSSLILADVKSATRKSDEPLLTLPLPPAATYVIEAFIRQTGAGRLAVRLDSQLGPTWTWDLSDVRGFWSQAVTLPVPTNGLLVEGDAAARHAIDRISIRALRVLGARERLGDVVAAHVARYGPAVVFLMAGRAYMEAAGTWIGGAATADFVIEPDPGTRVQLFVRNAAVENRVTLVSGTWRTELTLMPHEERMVLIPTGAGAATPLRVTTRAGARPADVDPSSDDVRLLGCWIETR